MNCVTNIPTWFSHSLTDINYHNNTHQQFTFLVSSCSWRCDWRDARDKIKVRSMLSPDTKVFDQFEKFYKKRWKLKTLFQLRCSLKWRSLMLYCKSEIASDRASNYSASVDLICGMQRILNSFQTIIVACHLELLTPLSEEMHFWGENIFIVRRCSGSERILVHGLNLTSSWRFKSFRVRNDHKKRNI